MFTLPTTFISKSLSYFQAVTFSSHLAFNILFLSRQKVVTFRVNVTFLVNVTFSSIVTLCGLTDTCLGPEAVP